MAWAQRQYRLQMKYFEHVRRPYACRRVYSLVWVMDDYAVHTIIQSRFSLTHARQLALRT